MKAPFIIILLTVGILFTFAQTPVKKDLMNVLTSVPVPPATVKESFGKVGVNGHDESSCSAEKIFASIEAEIKAFEAEFESRAKSSMGMAAPDASSEQAKKMNDPEMKKKMKSMTKEERMQMAMEMMKSAPGGTPPKDPPAVRDALDAWQTIYNDTQNEFQRSANAQAKEIELVEQYQRSHSEVDMWEQTEISTLPQISSGEMSAPDPAKVKEVRLKASEKHIALADKRLKEINARWRSSMDHARERYTVFYGKLIRADYASESKNFSTKKVLADAQMMILKEIRHHADLSRKAWEESASWQVRKMRIEKEE
ncbi:MAG: hypothetical protein ACYC09_02690 [Bacteroidota bacterium]